jgi:hypothetical protein
MSKFNFQIVIGLIFISFVHVANSTPITPPSVICDACMGQSATSAGTTLGTEANILSIKTQTHLPATQALTSAFISSSAAVQTLITNDTARVLQGMTASTNTIELAILKNTKAVERMADHAVKSIVSAYKSGSISEELGNISAILSANTQPQAGGIGANRAVKLREGGVAVDQLNEFMAIEFELWNAATISTSTGGSGLSAETILAEDESIWNPIGMIGKPQIDEASATSLQKMLKVITNPLPAAPEREVDLLSSKVSVANEMSRRINNVKLQVYYSVLANSLVNKMNLIDASSTDWLTGYINALPEAANGKVSMTSFMQSEMIGPSESEGWFLEIKGMSKTGLLREQVYNRSITNSHAYKMLEQRNKSTMIFAINALDSIKDED